MSESEHNVDDDAENHRFANRRGGLDPSSSTDWKEIA